MEELTAWVVGIGRLPAGRSAERGEHSMARWLSERRRKAAERTLDPAYRTGLAKVPEWLENPREAADENRWHQNVARLEAYRKATTGPATAAAVRPLNTAWGRGSTPSGTSAAAANWTR